MKSIIAGVGLGLITLAFLITINNLSLLDEKNRSIEMENIHLKEELKKANSDTTHKHCIKNYKP